MVKRRTKPNKKRTKRRATHVVRLKPESSAALIIVDVQRDFCPGGALAVPEGDRVVPVLNQYIRKFTDARLPVIFTRDWHPPDHSSFKLQGGPWPPHCVQGSHGARFHESLAVPLDAEIISKGDSKEEAYSGFQGTDIAQRLRSRGVRSIFVGGLATDYCVKETILDGLKENFKVYHLDDASLGVNVKSDDSEKALQLMMARGCKRVTLKKF